MLKHIPAKSSSPLNHLTDGLGYDSNLHSITPSVLVWAADLENRSDLSITGGTAIGQIE